MSSSIEKKIRIIHTCQWRLVREALHTSLSKKGNIDFLGTATNGRELLELLEVKKPDVVILDYNMPVMNGLEVLPVVKGRYPGVRVLMYTIFDDLWVVKKALELGADGYVTFDTDREDVYDAVVSVYRSRPYIYVGVRPSVPLTLKQLRPTEIEVLKYLSQNKSPEGIAEELGLLPITVGAITSQLKKMADVASVDDLIAIAREKGFLEEKIVPPRRSGKASFWKKFGVG